MNADQSTSAHLLKSTPDTFDIDSDFAAQIRADRIAGKLADTLEKYAPKVGWFQSPAVTLEDESTQALIEKTRQLWHDAQEIEY